MRLYKIISVTGNRWAGTQADAKQGARQVGGEWELVEVPTDKEGLLTWLNNHTIIDGFPLDPGPAEDSEVDELHEAEQRAIAAAAPPTDIVDQPKVERVQRDWDASDVEDFVLNRATVVQVERIFATLGTRFKELANENL